MTDRPLNPNDREKLAWCYHRALEAGDFETITSVLMMAERDPSLEKLILEVNDNRLSTLQGGTDTQATNTPFEEERDMTTLRIRQQKSYGIPWTAVAVLLLTFFFSLLLLGGLDLQPAPLPLQQGQGLSDIPEDPIALFQLYLDEVWNKQNMEAIPLLLSENHVHHDASMSEDIVGLEAFAEYVAFEHNVLPDVTFTVDSLAANGNEVVGRVTMSYEEFEKTVLVNATIVDGKLAETWFDVGTMVEAYMLDLDARYWELVWNIDSTTPTNALYPFIGTAIIWHSMSGPNQYGVSSSQAVANWKRDLSYCTNNEREESNFAKGDMVIHYLVSTCTFENTWTLDVPVHPTGDRINEEGTFIGRMEDGKFVEAWWYLDYPTVVVSDAILLEKNSGDDYIQDIYNLSSPKVQNRALAQRYVDEIWNTEVLDSAVFEELYAFRTSFAYNVDEVNHRISMLELHSAIKQAFPDATLEVTRMITDSSDIMILFTWTGTHTATFEYQDIVLPPSNEVVTTKGVIVLEIFTVQNNVVRETWYADFPFLAELEQSAEG